MDIIKKEYNIYLGLVFERISTQFFIRNKEDIFNFTKIGSWWHKDKEIDIVALMKILKMSFLSNANGKTCR